MADISKIKLPDETEVNLKDAQAFANIENDGQGGSSYTITRRDGTTKQVTIPNVTTTDPGLMTASDKTKIDTIEQGAEVNQQAFSKIRVTKGSAHTDLDADTKTDTLELIEGNNITLNPSAVSDAVTIHAKDTVYTLTQDATDGHIIILTNNDESSTDHVQTITIPDNNTVYTFAEGVMNKAFSVTPSGGSAQTVPIHGLGSASEKNFTTSVTSGSSDLVTSGAVASAISTAIDNLPEPMIFKGTLGTNGTITSLPTALSSNEGWTYKVITAGTYASQAAKVGDMFVSAKIGSAYQWVYVPSGDDVEDTWRNIKVNGTEKLGTGISSGAVDFVDGDLINITYANNKITVSHADTSSQASVSNSGRTYIQSVTLDGAGHVTKLTSATETVVNTDTNVTQTATNTNATYEVLFSGTADNTTRTEGARKYSNLTFNPSTGTLTTTKVVSANATLGIADIDTANITEDNVGNLIVTGAARFLNTINGSISGNAATASDAAKLNGYASDTAASNNTIARRTANGYIFATYFNQSSGAETPTSSSYIIYANSDGYFRKSTVANMKTAMSLNNVENKSSATIRGELTSANVTTALGYTPVNKAGDTITGRIAYNNVSMPLSAGKVTSLAAGTTEIFKDGIAISNPATFYDVGWIRVTGTGESDTVLEIATGDDGGMTNCEKTVVRQYNTSNAVAREAVLLNTDGTSSFPVSVTAPKFIGALQGNADTATKATQDESGNNIKASYAASFSISDHTITLKNKNGVSLGTVTVPDNNTTYSAGDNMTLSSTTFYATKRWNAVTQGQKWSRIMYVEPTYSIEGTNGILAVSCTRSNVVCNATFIVSTSHSSVGKISLIGSTNYSNFNIRVVVNSSGAFYFEIDDTANNIASGTAQTWHCSYLPLMPTTVTVYTAFTDGTTIPSGFTACNQVTTVTGDGVYGIRDITRSGTTFTATRSNGTTFTFTQQDSNDQFTLGTSGNSVVLSKNGTAQNTITVPYATSAGSATKATQDGSGNTITSTYFRYYGATATDGESSLFTSLGTKQYNNALPDGLTGVYKYGQTISICGTEARFDMYVAHTASGNGGGIRYRSGWGTDKQSWRTIIDSATIGSQSVNYATSSGSATKATQDSDGNAINTTYLKLVGGTMTGAITKSCTGGSWISQKDTATTFLRITGESDASRWDSIMAGKDYDGNVWVLGRIQKEFGIAGYKAARTDNATDWYHRINTETGVVTFSNSVNAPKFIGALQGNADTATKATQDSDGNTIKSTYLKLSGGTLTGNLKISHATSANMTADSTNPKITFAENGAQPVHITYTDYDSYRGPAGLKVVGGASATPAWFEVEGSIYSGHSVYTSVAVCANTANSGTAGGLALYGTEPTDYGIAFRITGNSGKHGYVQTDWAQYHYMSDSGTGRGWVFRNKSTTTNVASINTQGHMVLNGSLTLGGNEANTSGVRQMYNATTQSLDFIFV